jgi:hypothetical protein
MAASPLEVRIAHLEGAYEQIDKRMGSLEGRMESLERKLDDGFRWVIGIILVNWVTLMLAIFLRQ